MGQGCLRGLAISRLSYFVPLAIYVVGRVAAPSALLRPTVPPLTSIPTCSVAGTITRYARVSVRLNTLSLHGEITIKVGQWDNALFSGASSVPPVSSLVGQWDRRKKANGRLRVFVYIAGALVLCCLHIRRWH